MLSQAAEVLLIEVSKIQMQAVLLATLLEKGNPLLSRTQQHPNILKPLDHGLVPEKSSSILTFPHQDFCHDLLHLQKRTKE
jgi:hypothetical protein